MDETTTATAAEAEDTPVSASANADLDVDTAFLAASAGGHDAQAALALNAQQHGLDGLVPLTEAFACAEMFARMAVTSGKVEHIMVLARILANRYDIIGNSGLDEGSLSPLTEYYLLMKIAADAGDESATLALKTMADIVSVAPLIQAMWTEIVHDADPEGVNDAAAMTAAAPEQAVTATTDAG